ncbi:MAG: hypothetical protein Q4Q04_04230 [Methanocorpusculum sp.]|nr:hypothetical protein [Methanocorpusculum sp.]
MLTCRTKQQPFRGFAEGRHQATAGGRSREAKHDRRACGMRLEHGFFVRFVEPVGAFVDY